jgi:hypothetical protein
MNHAKNQNLLEMSIPRNTNYFFEILNVTKFFKLGFNFGAVDRKKSSTTEIKLGPKSAKLRSIIFDIQNLDFLKTLHTTQTLNSF